MLPPLPVNNYRLIPVIVGLFGCAAFTASAATSNQSTCSSAIAELESAIEALGDDQAGILRALENAIGKNEACAPSLTGSAIAAAGDDAKLVESIVFTALTSADESRKDEILSAARRAVHQNGNGGYGKSSYGKQPIGGAGHYLGANEAAILGDEFAIVDWDRLPPELLEALGRLAFSELSEGLRVSYWLGGFSGLSEAVLMGYNRVYGISPVAPGASLVEPRIPIKEPEKPDQPAGSGPPPPPISNPNLQMQPGGGDDDDDDDDGDYMMPHTPMPE